MDPIKENEVIKKQIKDLRKKGLSDDRIRKRLTARYSADMVDGAFIDLELDEEIERMNNNTNEQQKHQHPASIVVICPHCGVEQLYSPRKRTKRAHKYCISCHKHFDINPIHQQKLKEEKIADEQEFLISLTKLSLSKNQKTILEFIYRNQGSTQKQIAEATQLSISTVSRNIRPMIAMALIREENIGVKIYRINDKLAQQQQHKIKDPPSGPKTGISRDMIKAITVHNVRVKLPLKSGDLSNINFYYLKKKSKMKNWAYRYFDENGLTFQVSTKNIFFWPTGVGATYEEALRNLEEKSWKIKEYLENKYKITLGDPVFYWGQYRDGDPRGPHYVPIEDKVENIEEYKVAWSDRTPTEGSIETASKRFVERILGLEEAVTKLDDEVRQLSEKIQTFDMKPRCAPAIHDDLLKLQATFEQHLYSLRDEIVQQMPVAFTAALKNVFSNGGGSHHPSTSPPDFFL